MTHVAVLHPLHGSHSPRSNTLFQSYADASRSTNSLTRTYCALPSGSRRRTSKGILPSTNSRWNMLYTSSFSVSYGTHGIAPRPSCSRRTPFKRAYSYLVIRSRADGASGLVRRYAVSDVWSITGATCFGRCSRMAWRFVFGIGSVEASSSSDALPSLDTLMVSSSLMVAGAEYVMIG